MTRALLAVADGNEDIETVTLIDVLRRAGIEVLVTSIEARRHVTLARGTRLTSDVTLLEVQALSFDLIVLPGGMPGAQRLADSVALRQFMRRHVEAGKLYGAICAAPAVVLETWGLLDGRRMTCYPSFIEQVEQGQYVDEPVVVDGSCVTSQGPATAQAFALELVRQLLGEEARISVAKALLAPY
ncbi:4-methyl-5(b-hydroxyethyl)-thiazole monophosphate biosynthesis [Pseudomonas duriflava]|uniref:4-methyl-5(B-hydroxyethyl)-thiazole monophosphate biosynthesis n=1 Tax=Pseudomonas duriflava TaxID=459528 RepID=A0A562QPE9_9PSED|nr:DJ-1 family glyoxalase III [Pseudomonas duriflava]TWI58575.1 4-methyl-5(b-hydroxyethyl)-thiazole monophosphate biosynthesis [Pseudomonas duriflava]